MIETPFNYTGSKFKLLKQLLPELDYKKSTLVDVFCGGGSVYTNVLDRYKLNRVELYFNYVPITNQNILKYSNLWASESNQFRTAQLTSDIVNPINQLKSIQTQTEFDYSSTVITFSQEKSSSQFCFDYYFKLFYEKI